MKYGEDQLSLWNWVSIMIRLSNLPELPTNTKSIRIKLWEIARVALLVVSRDGNSAVFPG